MKKNILLILIFITMFFIGGNRVLAKTCKVGESGCTQEELDLSKEYSNLLLSCFYEVELDNGEKYYNYIYYDQLEKYFLAGSTAIGIEKSKLESLNESDSPFIFEDAKSSLNNYTCPKNSYLDSGVSDFIGDANPNEICFDNGNKNDCKQNGKELNFLTDFNTTVNSRIIVNNASVAESAKNGFNSSCDSDNNLKKEYGNLCRYLDKDNNYILLYYNSNATFLVWYLSETNQKFALKNGEEYSTLSNSWGLNTSSKYGNKISGISSCPSNLSLYKYAYAITTGDIIPTTNLFEYQYIYIPGQSIDKLDYSEHPLEDQVTNEYTLYPCEEEKPINQNQHEEPDCSLFSDELLKYINDAMDIIKIAVPILLVGLIIYDFATAVFSGAEDKINKIKGKAIKRIIIAIIIFFVPMFINFVFETVNYVWETNFTTCGIDQ